MSDQYAEQVRQQLAEARAEVERLRAHILDIDAHATPYGDLPSEPGYTGTYLVTAGALHRALGTIGHSAASCRAEAERDGAYRERAQLLAWLAAQHPAVLAPAPDVNEPGWQILYLNAGGQQLSWHIHPRDADLYGHVKQVPADDPRAQWDGHTTEQKYQRIAVLANSQSATTSSQIGSCPYDYHDMTDEERCGIPCMCQPHHVGGAYGCPEGCPTHNPGGEDVREGAIGRPALDDPADDLSDAEREAAWRETVHLGREMEQQSDAELHARFAHPGWEYATTEGPRKQWDDAGVPPEGDGWERNVAKGIDGWERFDFTEESYWRRPIPAAER